MKVIKLNFLSKDLSSLINISFAYEHTRMAKMWHVFGLWGCQRCFKVCQRWFVVYIDELLPVLSN